MSLTTILHFLLSSANIYKPFAHDPPPPVTVFQELWAITAPRPGTNSSSEVVTVKGGRMNPRNTCPWEESLTPRGPRRHGESIQVAFRKRLQSPNLSPPCPEVNAHLKIHVEAIICCQICILLQTFLQCVLWNYSLLFCVCKHFACPCPWRHVQRELCWASQHKAVSCERKGGTFH